jgi:hypothetical protein
MKRGMSCGMAEYIQARINLVNPAQYSYAIFIICGIIPGTTGQFPRAFTLGWDLANILQQILQRK